MRVDGWVRVSVVCGSWAVAGCVGSETPVATPADFAAAPSVRGWSVSNTFRDVSFEEFVAEDFVVVPLKVVPKPGRERFDTRRAAYVYKVDAPDARLGIRERYLWGSTPTSNGRGNEHYLYERLAFDMRAHRVFVIPRGGLSNVDREEAGGTRFWCYRDALSDSTAAIAGYGRVCPTAFIRTTGDTKGPPLLAGLQKEQYIIDTRFIARLLEELKLDEAASDLLAHERANREQDRVARADAQHRQLLAVERARFAGPRGQDMIDRAELGAHLCADIDVGGQPAVVSGFLEGVQGARIQLRVNNIRSPDGSTTYTLKAAVDGITYTPGQLVWVSREPWRACE